MPRAVSSSAIRFSAIRAKVAAMEGGGAPSESVLPFGDARIDGVLPRGGLPLGRWHEAAGEGLDIETGAAAAGFVAALAAPLARRGAVVWVMRRDDLYAPGLAGLGFPARDLIQVRVRDDAEALAALEDSLGAAGVAAAIGESAGVDLTAGRRLQLACERRGATGFVILRRPFGGEGRGDHAGSAAATRWRIAPSPSGLAPSGLVPSGLGASKLGASGLGPSRSESGGSGLGRSCWRVQLERCRGGRSGAWILETSDGAYPLRVVAGLGDRQLETPKPLRRAG